MLQIMVEVRVPNLDCEGCAAKLRKALFKLKGQLHCSLTTICNFTRTTIICNITSEVREGLTYSV